MTSTPATARPSATSPAVGPTGGPAVGPALLARVAGHPLAGQLVRFAAIGVLSTAAYTVLYLALRPVTGAFAANSLSLLITAVANTAANRRLTFGVRGGSGAVGDQVVGLLAFLAGLALTSGALALLGWLAPGAGRYVEVAVLVVANVLATVLRFLALRLRLLRAARAA